MPIQIEGKRFFFATEVAERIGVSRQTMWRWRKIGAIPPGYKHRSGRIIFAEDETSEIVSFANKVEPLGDPMANHPRLF